MNRFAKTILLAMMLLVLPMKQWGQQPYRQYAEDGILLNFHEIDNVDFRVFLLYNLGQDDRFVLIANEEPGQFSLSLNENGETTSLYDAFDGFYNDTYSRFTQFSKTEIFGLMSNWKDRVVPAHFLSITMDIAMRNTRTGNEHCANSDPFCTSDVITFNAASSSQTANQLDGSFEDGCIGYSYNPSWYHMRIQTAGQFIIHLEGHDPNTPSIERDVDFCIWGPFTDPTSPCVAQLTSDKIIDCSYSASYSENIYLGYPEGQHYHGDYTSHGTVNYHVPQVGEYYILMVTNYSQQPCVMSFTKSQGIGETDCGILPGIVDNDGPYCVGETIHLTVNAQAGATYSWSGPSGWTSSQQNPTRPNCTLNMAGTYSCTTSIGAQTTSATTEVVIYPQPTANFTATTVCQGEATQFTSTSTTNPAGQQITSYQWNFGDGQTSNQENPSHTYAQSGTFNVTLTVSCGDGLCTDTKTQTVTVHAAPVANAGPDQYINYGTSAQLQGSGGAGSFSFHWEPANKVVNANAQNTQTVVLTQDQTYTLTVSNTQGQCVSTDEVTIHINGAAMAVTAGPNVSICQGGNSQIYVTAGGGTGNYTYSWSPSTGLSATNIANPVASPAQTTTYTCTISDGQTTQTATVTVTVNDVIVENEYHTICPGDVYQWNGAPYTSPGTYQYNTTTAQGCDKTIYLHLDHYPTYDETTITHEMCSGESFTFYGTPYTSSIVTSYTDHTVQHGCDSIVRLNLTVWPENEVTNLPVSVCPEQLPYTFYGEGYYEPTDVIVLDADIHGCDSAVRLILDVSDYFIPATTIEHRCYDQTPTYNWYIADADTTIVIHEEGFYIDTLHTASCDGIFTLDLHFMQTPEVEESYVTACDSYYWPITGQTYSTTGTYGHSVSLHPFPCSQEYRLHLTIDESDTNHEMSFNEECDEVPFLWAWPENNPQQPIIDNGIFQFKYGETTQGCDSSMRVVVTNMRYTPDPTPIRSSDYNAVVFGDTIAVVTETEFFSFNYDFYVMEQGRSLWDECEWSISKPTWNIEQQFNADRKSSTCKVYVRDRETSHVVLTCKVRNSCMDAGEYIIHNFYLKSSYVGIDEFENDGEGDKANVSVIPNPNGGQMFLHFEEMQGRVEVKVFDTNGNKIDTFETYVTPDKSSCEYNMKRYSDGLYLFVISDSQRTVTRKVVIIH